MYNGRDFGWRRRGKGKDLGNDIVYFASFRNWVMSAHTSRWGVRYARLWRRG
jgi:hypothetical protein